MLFSAEHSFVYSQTPRTGSSTTTVLYRPYCGPANRLDGTYTPEIVSPKGVIGGMGKPDRYPVPRRFYRHMPLSEIKAEIGEALWEAATVFTNIRNPFSHLMSIMRRQVKAGRADASTAAEARAWVDSYVIGDYAQKIHRLTHVHGVYALDDVIVFEALSAEVARMNRKLGLPAAPDLPQRDATTGVLSEVQIADCLSPEARTRVLSDFGWHFERFGYSTHPDDALEAPRCLVTAPEAAL